MADSTNQWQVETQNSAGRGTAALAIAIPITLSGKDANGVEFTEKARTIAIHKRGGKIATKCSLRPGSEITLHNPIVGQTARIRVIWVSEKRAGDEPYEVSVQLLGSENIWGIDFVSSDRQESALQTPRPKVESSRMPSEAASSPGPSAMPKLAVPDAGSALGPAKTNRPASSLAAASLQAPQPSPLPAVATPAPSAGESNAAIEATLSRLIQQIGAASEDEARLFQEKAGELSRPSGPPRQTNLPDSTKKFEGREGSVAEQIKRLEGGLQACRNEMQQFAAELEEMKRAVQHEMGKTLKQIQESRPKLVELAMSDLEVKVKKEITSVADEVVDLTQKRVQEEASAALEPLMQAALERVYSVGDEQSARVGEQVQGIVSRLIQEGQAQLVHELQSAASELKKELQRISGMALAYARAEIAQAGSKAALGFKAQLQNTLDEVAESTAKQLQKQTEDTLLLLDEELKTCGKNITAEMEERLASVGRSALGSVSSAAEEALEEFQARLGQRAEIFANDCVKGLGESLAKAAVEHQRLAASSFRKALEQECAQTLARMKCELGQALQEVTGQSARQASALNDLRKAVEEESLQTLANMKAAANQAIGEVSGQIERQANALKELCGEVREESATALAQAKSDATQAVRRVSEQVERDRQEFNNLRNSLTEEFAQALPKFQQALQQAMGEVADQVQEQVNMLCSLLNLIEKESAQVLSRVKSDVAQALAETSLLAGQHVKTT